MATFPMALETATGTPSYWSSKTRFCASGKNKKQQQARIPTSCGISRATGYRFARIASRISQRTERSRLIWLRRVAARIAGRAVCISHRIAHGGSNWSERKARRGKTPLNASAYSRLGSRGWRQFWKRRCRLCHRARLSGARVSKAALTVTHPRSVTRLRRLRQPTLRLSYQLTRTARPCGWSRPKNLTPPFYIRKISLSGHS